VHFHCATQLFVDIGYSDVEFTLRVLKQAFDKRYKKLFYFMLEQKHHVSFAEAV